MSKTIESRDTTDLKHRVYRNEGNQVLLPLLPADAKRVLDVGCGAGDNPRHLRECGRRVWESPGVTLSGAEADLARRYCEDVRVVNVEAADLDIPDGFFDAILCSHVLEHLVYPQVALRQLCRYKRIRSPSYGVKLC